MKKIFKYILILVIVVSNFSFRATVNAQVVRMGACTINGTPHQDVDEGTCNKYANHSFSWYGDGHPTITNYDINPKSIQPSGPNTPINLTYTFKFHIDDVKIFKKYCQSPSWRTFLSWPNQPVTQPGQGNIDVSYSSFNVAGGPYVPYPKDYSFDFSRTQGFSSVVGTTNPSGSYGSIYCGNTEIIKSAPVAIAVAGRNSTSGTQAALPDACDSPKKMIGGRCTGPYTLLAPLPCSSGEGCEKGLQKTLDPTKGLSAYLNIMIKIFIGLSAVMAVVMIVMGGIEYMTSELISSKEAGRDRITNAVLGLILALGSYALLYTINPDLLNTDVVVQESHITYVDKFVAIGALTRSGDAVIVNFSEAYAAAKAASQQTGVDTALILAIFAQETGGGANTGRCTPANANMYPEDLAALGSIVGAANVSTTNVSCASGGGHGGAIGLMQFRPVTWLQYASGRDPWKLEDSIFAAATYLKALGGINDPYNAACQYFSGVICTPGRSPANVFYGESVVAKMNALRIQITDMISKGTLPQ